MRALMLATTILICSCANQPATPPTAASGERLATTDAQRMEMARNLNLKTVDKDGQRLYCRSNFVTASRIQRDTTCYTADELEKLQDQQQRELDRFNSQPTPPGKNPLSQ